MKTLLCFALLMLAYGQSEHCCAPDQWEGSIGMTQGYATPGHPAGVETSTMKIHSDFTNQRVATFSNFQVGSVQTQQFVLEDYAKKTKYTVHLAYGSCSKEALPYPMQKTCTPYSATRLPTEVFGGGSDTAIVDNYLLTNPSFNETFAFTREKCLPFSRMLWGNFAGVPMLQVYKYSNITFGINDPTVFNLPSSCRTA